MSRKNPIAAFAYLRTSSAANVGADKDSEHRQRSAIEAFAKRSGYQLAGEFYDAAVSGADQVDARPGFAAMLERIEANGVRTIVVETANRFARDLMVQEVGYRKLRERGIELIAADSPEAFIDDGPTATLVRQVLGAIAQFDKAMTVAKLRGARDRVRREQGKCEGRRTRLERLKDQPEAAQRLLEAATLAKQLRRASPKTGKRRSFQQISEALKAAGYLNESGRKYHPESVKRLIEGGLQ
jgi:DNA invertase Pin-like site-specific DNA recombinase